MLDVFVLGIDVSKDTLSCTLLEAATRRPRWHKEVKNTLAGWNQLLRHAPEAAAWILEPTGRYSRDVARTAREAGRDVRLAQPRKAQLFLKSVQSRAKTDKLDATGLALYGLSCLGTACDLASQRSRPSDRGFDQKPSSSRTARRQGIAKGTGYRAGDRGYAGVAPDGALFFSLGSVCRFLRSGCAGASKRQKERAVGPVQARRSRVEASAVSGGTSELACQRLALQSAV